MKSSIHKLIVQRNANLNSIKINITLDIIILKTMMILKELNGKEIGLGEQP
jgi:hypothetical protein